jgi:hypothetical protein
MLKKNGADLTTHIVWFRILIISASERASCRELTFTNNRRHEWPDVPQKPTLSSRRIKVKGRNQE